MRNPIIGIAVCGARTASGHVAAMPPIRLMNFRRLIGFPNAQDGPLWRVKLIRWKTDLPAQEAVTFVWYHHPAHTESAVMFSELPGESKQIFVLESQVFMEWT